MIIEKNSALAVGILTLSSVVAFGQTGGTPKGVGPVSPGGLDALRKTPVVEAPARLPKDAVRLNVVPLTAAVVRPNRAVQHLDVDSAMVTLRRGEMLVTKNAVTAERRPPSDASQRGSISWRLPYEFRFLNDQGVIRTAQLVAELAGGGIRMDQRGHGFIGTVLVALEDKQDRSQVYALPVPAHVLVTAPIDKVDPQDFTIDATNKWISVGLNAQNPPERFRAKIRSSTDPDGLEIDVDTIRPTLSVLVTPENIQGLGLELATVNVVAEGLVIPQGREITLTTPVGSLKTTQVKLDDQGAATTQFRSISTGTTKIEANSPGLARGESRAITFSMPWVFLLAAMLGGTVGAFIRRRHTAKRSTRDKPSVLVDALYGALSGLVVATLYSVGINVLPVTPSATGGEALVFSLATLGGFLGLRISAKT